MTSTNKIPVQTMAFLARRRGRGSRSRNVPWYFIAPALLAFLFVILVPAARGIGYAFTNWNGLSQSWSFIGVQNFITLAQDVVARGALFRTVELAFVVTILQTVVGLVMAVLVNAGVRFQSFYRVLFFSPIIVMPIITSYLWQYILGTNGPLNQGLQLVGLGSLARPWLGQPTTAYWSIVLVMVWQFSGVGMAIFLAGLQSVPPELLEAADIDGAGAWAKFRYVTWPLLRPALTVNAVLIMITGLKVFDQVWIITGGGPGGSTESVSTLVYRNAFSYGEYGYAIAMAVILTIVLAVVSGVQYSILSRRQKA